jgi:serine/threonine protein kinase
MSPEQCSGDAVDTRSDIYSIGCALFEAVTGYVPFEALTAVETIIMHQEQKPPLISDALPDAQYPPSLDLVLGKCLAKLPQNRYQSAKELAIDLTRIKEGKDLTAYSYAFSREKADENLSEELPKTTWVLDRARISSRKQEQHPTRQRTKILAVAILTCLSASIFVLISLRTYPEKLQKKSMDAQLKQSSKFQIESKIKQSKPEEDYEPLSLIEAPRSSRAELTPYSTLKTVGGSKVRTFDFPLDVLIGQMYLYDTPNDYSFRGIKEAKGKLVCADSDLRIFCPARVIGKYPQYARRFQKGDISVLLIFNFPLPSSGSDDEVLQACSAIVGGAVKARKSGEIAA